MKNLVKNSLRKMFPDLIASYHYYRNRKMYQAMKTGKTAMGFALKGMGSMQDGKFEPEETEIIERCLQHVDVFIDVGANIGYFVCVSRKHGTKTIAVEPLPDNLSVLYENLRMNNWNDVEVFPMGLAAEPGNADLYGGGTWASLLPNWAGASELSGRPVALSTLDIILGNRFVGKRLFVKIDVEGAEFGVLKGALNTLSMQPKPIWLIEICLTELKQDGMNERFEDTFNLFWERGYEAVSLGDHRRVITRDDVRRWVANRARDDSNSNYMFRLPE